MTDKRVEVVGKQFELIYVAGVEGNSIYLNDFRIAGPKPWGGGKILKEWKVDLSDILEATALLALLKPVQETLEMADCSCMINEGVKKITCSRCDSLAILNKMMGEEK